ncbi:hypothetical protein MU448_07465 [Streptococcus sp. O1]|nr:hypothetical protein [Streptococcus sp. O1]
MSSVWAALKQLAITLKKRRQLIVNKIKRK